MELTREQELQLFRNVNGVNSIWDKKSDRTSYNKGSDILSLRKNQGYAKSKLLRYSIKHNLTEDYWVGGEQ